ncbi:MAG: hypothetical protein JW876_01725 [Candidatus Krumholzibacteriota bacterium]|uniref:DUF1573 domain-containing protein n=1 Tax=Eiseniibacteriota bacterium TaxID=2212470 RepID=A0A7V2ATG0_UNCEI|nr:hypothetical protein [Candidatus Krumholzibacteriota bacterium]HER42953.1 hypothetical protein [Candidatus Eisenbacteria bacterium]
MADYEKVILPGQEGTIGIKIYGHKIHPGHFRKSFTITTNDPTNRKMIVHVDGDVTKVFDVTRDLYLSGFADETLRLETDVISHLDTPIRITGYHWAEGNRDSETLADKLSVTIEEIEAGRQYRVRLATKVDLEAGHHYVGDLYLETDFPKLKEKKLSVRMTITPDVEVHPKNVIMREMQVREGTSKSFDRVITVIAARADSLKIRDIIADRDDISVSIKEVQPGKSFRCTVRVRPPSEPGKYVGNLRILTNYPGYEEIPVKIMGSVRITSSGD